MRYCLRVLRSVVSTGDELALQDLADQGAINQIISMYNYSSFQEQSKYQLVTLSQRNTYI